MSIRKCREGKRINEKKKRKEKRKKEKKKGSRWLEPCPSLSSTVNARFKVHALVKP
jgi:hypothetical protein